MRTDGVIYGLRAETRMCYQQLLIYLLVKIFGEFSAPRDARIRVPSSIVLYSSRSGFVYHYAESRYPIHHSCNYLGSERILKCSQLIRTKSQLAVTR